MCGIYGITDHNPKFIQNYIETCNYRGPDGSRVWCDPNYNVTLGHNLLSIMATPKQSMQPWMTPKGNTLVYNGEIFNYYELKTKYNQFIDTTGCDTELLAWGLDTFGLAFLEEIDSMHGFAYYEPKKKQITLSRDHAGIKPVYYAEIKEGLVFGSEIKGLIDKVPNAHNINPLAMKSLELIGVNPLRDTFFTNIKKVLPGESIVYDIENKKIKNNYRIYMKPTSNHKFDPEEYRDVMSKTVKMTTIGRRKIGSFLSGGLDSSVIVYEAKKHLGSMDCFTHHYDPLIENDSEDFHSDFDTAKRFTKDFNLNLNPVLCTPKDYKDNFLKAVYHYEEPILNCSMPAYYQMSNYMKNKGIVVALTGDLGDEMLCGYKHHYKLLSSNIKSWKELINKELLTYIREPVPIDQNLPTKQDVLEEFIKIYNDSSLWNPDDVCASFIGLECLSFASEEYFGFADKFGMANSIESRFPYATKLFMNYALSIPSKDKIHSLELRKSLPRKAYKNILPDYVINKRKTGWDSPAHNWITEKKNKELFDFYKKSLSVNRHIPTWFGREWVKSYKMTAPYNSNPIYPKKGRWEIWTRNDKTLFPI